MKTFKYIQDFLSSLFSSFLSIVKILGSSRRASALPPKSHETCVILGNGPSLEESVNLAKKSLRNVDLMCVNFFPISHLFESLKPRYFVACDSAFWDKKVTEELVQKKIEQIFDTFKEKVNWEFYLFMPISAKKKGDWQQRISGNEHIKIIYYNLTPIEGFKSVSNFLFKLKLGIPRPHNVLIPSLFHSVNLNYSEIFIFGAEHSWLNEITVDNENNVFVGHRHFYKEEKTNNQIKHNYTEHKKLHEVLKTFMTAFKSYIEIEDYSKTRNVKIYNATPTSFIDAFERKKFLD